MRYAVIGLVFVVSACGASKSRWIEEFERQFPTEICNDDQYFFRKCFSIDEVGCRQVATRTVHACLEKHADEIPDQLDRTAGEHAGGLVGGCAGKAFEVELTEQGKRLHVGTCDDPSAWGGLRERRDRSGN